VYFGFYTPCDYIILFHAPKKTGKSGGEFCGNDVAVDGLTEARQNFIAFATGLST
jgi:hypothetical protein